MTWKQNQMNDIPIPKGKVKIRILDKDKNVKQEVSGENYISEEFKHWFYKNAIANIFVEEHQSGGTLLNNFNKRLWLTDYDGEENPDDPYMRGNVIGWANMSGTYSGGNFMQGGVNAKRTGNPSFEGVKIYIDFPFDFGVGENINSVYITLSDHSVSGEITRSREGFYNKRNWLIPFEDGFLTRDYDDYNYVQKLNSTMQKSGEKIRSDYKVSQWSAIWHNGALYGSRDDSIRKLKQLGSSEYETVVSGYTRLSGLVKYQDRIFSTGRKSREERVGVIEFDSNFNEIGHYPFPEFNGSLPSDYKVTDSLWYDEKWGVIGGDSWSFDIDTKTFSYDSSAIVSGMVKDGIFFIDAKDSLNWQTKNNYISRFKLPEPVTKKPEDYMQAVYEYQFDPECLFPFPEDWLDS